MNECWVLTIKTSLPHTCEHHGELQTECLAFDSFQKAKAALRKRLHGFAFTRNAMFDGEGKMIHLDRYSAQSYDCAELDEEEDFLDNGCLTTRRINILQAALAKVFEGKSIQLPFLEDGDYVDGMLELEVHDNRVWLQGWDDGPCNGYKPLICTNMFNMVKEGDYYLYLDDLFGQDDCSAELYVDLKKAEVK